MVFARLRAVVWTGILYVFGAFRDSVEVTVGVECGYRHKVSPVGATSPCTSLQPRESVIANAGPDPSAASGAPETYCHASIWGGGQNLSAGLNKVAKDSQTGIMPAAAAIVKIAIVIECKLAKGVALTAC
jgi:hypothetical protein